MNGQKHFSGRMIWRFGPPGMAGLILSASSVLLTAGAVHADTVRMKDGRVFANVRSQLQGKEIRLQFADGTVRLFPSEELRSIEPGPVRPDPLRSDTPRPGKDPGGEPAKSPSTEGPSPEPPGREVPAPSSSREISRPEDTVLKPHRKSWMWAPVPIWSGLIGTEKNEIGIAMAITKSLAFLIAAGYQRQPEGLVTRGQTLLLLIRQRDASLPVSDTLTSYFLLKNEQVKAPYSNNVMTTRAYSDRRVRTGRLFILLVLVDAGLSYRQSVRTTASPATADYGDLSPTRDRLSYDRQWNDPSPLGISWTWLF